MKNIIIDFEFTGLQNPEIIQIKAKCLENGLTAVKNFKSHRKMTASAVICCGGKISGNTYFSKTEFDSVLKEIGASDTDNFIGFSISKDKEALGNYNILIENYQDIQETIMRSKYERIIANEGRSLEACYYIVTSKMPSVSNHDGIKELNLIVELYYATKRLHKKPYLTVFPWGKYAGMDLAEYINDNRRAADGYRYNHNDLLSKSLDLIIDEATETGVYTPVEIEVLPEEKTLEEILEEEIAKRAKNNYKKPEGEKTLEEIYNEGIIQKFPR